MQINVNAQNSVETINFTINGVDVDLNTLIANGDVTVVSTGNGYVNGGGDLQGNGATTARVTTLQFNMDIDSIALSHTGGQNGSVVGLTVTEVTPPPPPDGTGADTLDGGDGDDQLFGEAGDDVLTVGVGDTASGGDDADTFHLDFTQTSSSGATDITIDGGTGENTGADDDTLDLTGLGAFTYSTTTDADGNSVSGTATFASGQVVNFSEIENLVTCFTTGSMILTDCGEVAVERLKVGDLVETRDHGAQPVR